jgi:hypothetical protein
MNTASNEDAVIERISAVAHEARMPISPSRGTRSGLGIARREVGARNGKAGARPGGYPSPFPNE